MSNLRAIKIREEGEVAILSLNEPERHNVLTQAARQEILAQLKVIGNDVSVGVVIITGEGERFFCAGMDVREFTGRTGLDQCERDLNPNRIFEVIEGFEKPVIAMVNGYAFGGGCELALSCDLRVCSDDSEFGLLEINFSLVPGGGGTQRLTRLVGKGQAMRMILSGEKISAAEAYRIGLVEKVVPKAELMAETLALAGRIAKHNSLAFRYAKEAINATNERNLADGLKFESLLMGLCLEGSESEGKIEGFLRARGKIGEVDRGTE